MNRTLLAAASAFVAVSATAQEPAPATVAELRAAVDWATFPLPPGATDVRHRFASSTYKAPGTFADAAAFFRKAVPPLGWVEGPPTPGIDQNAYLYLDFAKGPMRLAVNGYRIEPTGPMTVTVSLLGNVDVRTFPRPADAAPRTQQPTAVMYATVAAPADAAKFCADGVRARGWRETPATGAAMLAKEGRIVQRFVQNGMEVGVVAAKEADGKTMVTCHTSVRHTFDPADVRALAAKDVPPLPTLKDYTAVLDLRQFPLMPGAKKQDRQTASITATARIACEVPATLAEVVAFHRKEFAARGWAETAADTDIPDRVELTYEKQGYLVTVGAMEVRGKKATDVGITNHGNVDPRQLPYPAGVELEAERDTFVNATTTLTEAAAVAFYRAELGKLGWKELTDVRGRGSYEFAQNAAVLRLEVGKDVEKRTSLKLTPTLVGVK